MSRAWVVGGLIVVLLLTVLLLVISLRRARLENSADQRSFEDLAEECGLNIREKQILTDIAIKGGLKRIEPIFTMASAFDLGADRLLEESLGKGHFEDGGIQFRTEISFLREKLGFPNRRDARAGLSGDSRKFSSRQILAGRKLQMTRRRAAESGDIEATVVDNTEAGLLVELAHPLTITFEERWCIRYYSGTSVWEFDTSVVSYDGNKLVLAHSDQIRFINRRRFLRVPVGRRAFIARFPFCRAIPVPGGHGQEVFESHDDPLRGAVNISGPPEFVPAVVTELAGPGLRIDSTLRVEIGERILVVFSLDEDADLSPASEDGGCGAPTFRIVEDIGQVRHVRKSADGFSIAVELTGLNDSDIDELIRATNAALVKIGGRRRAETPGAAGTSVPEETLSHGASNA